MLQGPQTNIVAQNLLATKTTLLTNWATANHIITSQELQDMVNILKIQEQMAQAHPTTIES